MPIYKFLQSPAQYVRPGEAPCFPLFIICHGLTTPAYMSNETTGILNKTKNELLKYRKLNRRVPIHHKGFSLFVIY